MPEQASRLHARGRVAFGIITHIYEDSWQIRGYEQFLMDMMERPEWCEHILDRIKERNMLRACAAARAGVDILLTGDTTVANQRGLMFSKPQWRRFIKSRWQEVYAAAKAIKPDIQIWYHSDGNISEIIPELIEIGVDILNPVQPECVDPVELKREYGDRLVFRRHDRHADDDALRLAGRRAPCSTRTGAHARRGRGADPLADPHAGARGAAGKHPRVH